MGFKIPLALRTAPSNSKLILDSMDAPASAVIVRNRSPKVTPSAVVNASTNCLPACLNMPGSPFMISLESTMSSKSDLVAGFMACLDSLRRAGSSPIPGSTLVPASAICMSLPVSNMESTAMRASASAVFSVVGLIPNICRTDLANAVNALVRWYGIFCSSAWNSGLDMASEANSLRFFRP